MYSLRDGGTLYLSDWSGVYHHEEDLEIEEVMETPAVGPGDLLLLSHNTIHATQTTDDRRLAVSLRTCDPETPIDWHRVAGSPTPRMMSNFAGRSNNRRTRVTENPGDSAAAAAGVQQFLIAGHYGLSDRSGAGGRATLTRGRQSATGRRRHGPSPVNRDTGRSANKGLGRLGRVRWNHGAVSVILRGEWTCQRRTAIMPGLTGKPVASRRNLPRT